MLNCTFSSSLFIPKKFKFFFFFSFIKKLCGLFSQEYVIMEDAEHGKSSLTLNGIFLWICSLAFGLSLSLSLSYFTQLVILNDMDLLMLSTIKNYFKVKPWNYCLDCTQHHPWILFISWIFLWVRYIVNFCISFSAFYFCFPSLFFVWQVGGHFHFHVHVSILIFRMILTFQSKKILNNSKSFSLLENFKISHFKFNALGYDSILYRDVVKCGTYSNVEQISWCLHLATP